MPPTHTQGSSFPAAAATRGVLMETAHHPEDGEAPFKYKLVSSLGHTRVLTSFMLNQVSARCGDGVAYSAYISVITRNCADAEYAQW
jgi:hypothetical protein